MGHGASQPLAMGHGASRAWPSTGLAGAGLAADRLGHLASPHPLQQQQHLIPGPTLHAVPWPPAQHRVHTLIPPVRSATVSSRISLAHCDVVDDFVTIRVNTDAPRWRLQLMDSSWHQAFESSSAWNEPSFSLRLTGAALRALTVRVCTADAAGDGPWTKWAPVATAPMSTDDVVLAVEPAESEASSNETPPTATGGHMEVAPEEAAPMQPSLSLEAAPDVHATQADAPPPLHIGAHPRGTSATQLTQNLVAAAPDKAALPDKAAPDADAPAAAAAAAPDAALKLGGGAGSDGAAGGDAADGGASSPSLPPTSPSLKAPPLSRALTNKWALEGATAAEALNAAWQADGARKLVFGSASAFRAGLEALIGLPHPKFMSAMEREHCSMNDSRTWLARHPSTSGWPSHCLLAAGWPAARRQRA
jgi:hypothetical protein